MTVGSRAAGAPRWAAALALTCGALTACQSPGVEDPGIPDWDGEFEVEPPARALFEPCPDGWEPVVAADGVPVITCEPWPAGGPAMPPQLTPCPTGWREVTDPLDAGPTICHPWPEEGAQECGVDEAHFPGEPGCSRIGTDCPEGDWADDLPEDETIYYVKAGARAGGVGSRELPFATIAEATEAASRDAVIALSKGTFDESVDLGPRLALWGACVAETIVTSTAPDDVGATIDVTGQGARLQNLQIRGAARGVQTRSRTSIHIEDVLINGSHEAAIYAKVRAVMTARNLVIRDTGADELGEAGRGLNVQGEADVEVTRAVLEGNREAGIFVSDPESVVRLTSVAVRRTRSRVSDGWFGAAIWVQEGGRLQASQVVVEGNQDAAVMVSDEGSQVLLTDAVLLDTAPRTADGTTGDGIWAQQGATVEANRVVVAGNPDVGVVSVDSGTLVTVSDLLVRGVTLSGGGAGSEVGLSATAGGRLVVDRAVVEQTRLDGIFVHGVDSTAELTDIVVRDTLGMENGDGGRGLLVRDGGNVDVRNGVFERNHGFGVVASEPGTTLTLDGVIARDNEPEASTGLSGHGVNVHGGATATLERLLLERNVEVGLFASGDATTVDIEHLVVRNTQPGNPLGAGRGVNIQEGAQVTLSDAWLHDNVETDILAHGTGTSVRLTDVVSHDTRSSARDGEAGHGADAHFGARLEVTRAHFARNREAAVVAAGPDSRAELEHVVVHDTQARECIADRCADLPAGHGIVSLGGSHVDVRYFTVSGCLSSGVLIAVGTRFDATGRRVAFDEAGAMDLHDGEISGNAFGANVQASGYDLGRLQDRVIYRDNDRNLNSSELPLPMPFAIASE